jgi:hypothetical protein
MFFDGDPHNQYLLGTLGGRYSVKELDAIWRDTREVSIKADCSKFMAFFSGEFKVTCRS